MLKCIRKTVEKLVLNILQKLDEINIVRMFLNSLSVFYMIFFIIYLKNVLYFSLIFISEKYRASALYFS